MLCWMLAVSATLTFVCQGGPIGLDGLGPLWWTRPNGMCGIWYFGVLFKLCAYGFMDMVSGTSNSKGMGLA